MDRIKNAKKVMVLGVLLFMQVSAFASDVSITQPAIQKITPTSSQMIVPTVENTAASWGLSVKDYERYKWLMQNTPSGHWYQQLDPAEVLALNSDDPKDMMKYAKIQAQNMHGRVTRELLFDQLYRKAYQTLYPNEKPIMSKGAANLSGMTLAAGDHIWLFLSTDAPLGSFLYQHLIKIVQATPGTMLDIYFVGKKVSQKNIEAWAMSANIPPSLVNQKVTLNYGNTRYESLSQNKTLDLPFIGIVHQRHFQPISLSSVLSLHV